jgi:hypothetical protein
MHSLEAFWHLLLPWPRVVFVLYALSALVVGGVTVWCWRSRASLHLRYAIFLLGTTLIDPHLTDYDLVILMPALLLIGDFIMQSAESPERDAVRILTYAAYCLPLFGPLLKGIHLQLSVPVFVGLFLVLASIIRKGADDTAGKVPVMSAAASAQSV